MLTGVLTALLAVLALGILIIVHEWGHYFVARLCNMRVDRFSIGFGPSLVSVQRGETLFQIGWIPLGGYVLIAGLNPEDEAIKADDPRAYPNRPAWQRFATIAAGPLVNYVFAVLLLLGLNWIAGIPGAVAEQVIPNRPAAVAGMQVGDRIMAIDGRTIVDATAVPKAIQRSGGRPVQIEVLRKGQPVTLTVTPALDQGVYRIGILPQDSEERHRQGFLPALERSVGEPLFITWMNMQALIDGIRGRQKMEFGSPIMIVREMKKQIGMGAARGLRFIAIISTLLGFFNLLPLPALDGGRLVFLAWELTTRRRVNQRVEQVVHLIGMVILLGLLLLLAVKDIRNWVKGN